ncbi:arginine--tRNA ligase [Anaerosalibacter bizertensis]|uniref:Arginine--tRNA ligase n=1 Tax=Anaerosalibacter bizertensis TaxID=932217 RepID=A0A9Q4AD90_9FIRM|nr:arginine--tRNA ligase [Anaerosalibacter bizertensis]MBV1819156.1 arginine--tRNA ligase [Bacteroidales bacterium MSK.15.36]MCB5560106.1 arginine--tRNA ligase [Anaerosalibacter bizertensis]MCG4565759.1 arginine--tRNA ligase [Anaerosalibacter bizertensis]MCG4583090.1 arginine--tRNA ligase [Anaerosalibacter bizertensis]
MIDFKNEVVKIISGLDEKLDEKEIMSLIEVPPSYEMGDYAFPCFKLAKIFRKAPNLIAEEISNKIQENSYFEKIENAGPYVNFFIDRAVLAETVLEEIKDEKERYGSSNIGKGKTVIVEYSSPNIAKPFHIGHIRTTIIGHALYRIYSFLGYDTVAINHLGDYGTQFGKLIVAYKKWGDRSVIEKDPINELLKLYIKFHEEVEKEPSLDNEARKWFKKLEDGDNEATELWKWMREISLEEFNKVYDMLGIEFDSFTGESFYSDKMSKVVEELQNKGLLVKSEGADIVDLEPYNMPPALIRKSDGSTLYITRDIAAAIYRKEHYDFYKNIYVVGSEQKLHFDQWRKIIDLMGYDWAEDCIHVTFGMVRLEEGTMSTRKGRVVFLEDVFKKAIEKTKDIIKERNPKLENKEEVAKQVGIGAIVFQELFNSRIKDYVFSWDKTLSFEGETGPYVQYAHARANSLLKKGEFSVEDRIDYSLLNKEEEIDIIRLLYDFPKTIINSSEKNEPSFITRHITEIAKNFNRFYHNCPILNEEEDLRKARLHLVYATKLVLNTGLLLLGIEAPDKM